MAMAELSMYSGTSFPRMAEVAAEASDGFMTTALPAAMAPAAGTNKS